MKSVIRECGLFSTAVVLVSTLFLLHTGGATGCSDTEEETGPEKKIEQPATPASPVAPGGTEPAPDDPNQPPETPPTPVDPNQPPEAPPPGPNPPNTDPAVNPPAAFMLMSDGIAEGRIVRDYACVEDGPGALGLSPHLKWVNPPAGAAAFSISMIDLDMANLVHWRVDNIPASATELARGSSLAGLPTGAIERLNVEGNAACMPVCPPPGETHRYRFEVCAYDARDLAGDQMESHRLGCASFDAAYQAAPAPVQPGPPAPAPGPQAPAQGIQTTVTPLAAVQAAEACSLKSLGMAKNASLLSGLKVGCESVPTLGLNVQFTSDGKVSKVDNETCTYNATEPRGDTTVDCVFDLTCSLGGIPNAIKIFAPKGGSAWSLTTNRCSAAVWKLGDFAYAGREIQYGQAPSQKSGTPCTVDIECGDNQMCSNGSCIAAQCNPAKSGTDCGGVSFPYCCMSGRNRGFCFGREYKCSGSGDSRRCVREVIPDEC